MQAPPDEELNRIEGVLRVERLTAKRFRIHFPGNTDTERLVRKMMEAAVAGDWQLSEVFPEKESLDTIFARLSGEKQVVIGDEQQGPVAQRNNK